MALTAGSLETGSQPDLYNTRDCCLMVSVSVGVGGGGAAPPGHAQGHKSDTRLLHPGSEWDGVLGARVCRGEHA